ncbi:nuclease-related domain-containing protein [Planococcus sp. APC 3900]|uniref:nuclease-related domain-containing protein n=1 Tax=Planococcus sp. APC 3900 TaxID=3035191 RepID=UPI0025B3C96D|nr:nuclease-related domain-containing protein [Planococcus sp. APC 3900]MDN3438181.1 nuclease-related domain-containing protein [Planococcus sp. APC 3900]
MNDFLLAQMVAAERLPNAHESKAAVLLELKSSLAGASGEQRTATLLKRELDLPGETIFLNDVHIPYKDGTAQIDLLLIHEQMVCVLEVKNMVGEFYFDSVNFQFHRIIDGRREGMRNPEAQLHRAVRAVSNFLGVSVHGVIVLASRSGKVVEAPKHYPVVSLDYLPFHLEQLMQGSNLFDARALASKLRGLPVRNSSRRWLERHNISFDSLRLGVTCPSCRTCSLDWRERKWKCVVCGFYSQDAHEVALQEYAVLFGDKIDTGLAYRLLGVENKYVLYRLLQGSAIQGDVRGKRQIVEDRQLLREYFGRIYR